MQKRKGEKRKKARETKKYDMNKEKWKCKKMRKERTRL